MRKVSLFTEDFGHEEFLRSLLQRLAREQKIKIDIHGYSVRGGFGAVVTELKQYVEDLLRYREDLPDLVVVAADANCQGFGKRRRQLQEAADSIKDRVAFAVPDPHVERWLLLDASAFKRVLGRACEKPDLKCARDRYKDWLTQAVVKSGATPLLGGFEYAEEIVAAMDLERVRKEDRSLGALLEDLTQRFRLWQTAP